MSCAVNRCWEVSNSARRVSRMMGYIVAMCLDALRTARFGVEAAGLLVTPLVLINAVLLERL
eukprot:1270163-Pleurochrysis_carterae.AAC.1